METGVLIAAGGLLVAALGLILGQRRTTRQDVKQDAVNTATVNVKLDGIGSDVREIKADVRSVRDDVKELRERMVAVESSTKQAHKRIDGLEGRKE